MLPVDKEGALTLYDKNNMMVGNPANCYSISSIPIPTDESTNPEERHNWLSAPKGDFWLMIYVWKPKDKWKLPGIVPVKLPFTRRRRRGFQSK